jgi:hypothetical protein
VALIVGSFVRVVLSIGVMIACRSALYIEDWDNLVICDDSEFNLVVLQRFICVDLIIFFVFGRHKGCELSLDSFVTRFFGLAREKNFPTKRLVENLSEIQKKLQKLQPYAPTRWYRKEVKKI